MNCNIIKDLIPLYIDDCCSEETSIEVKKHIGSCDDCKRIFDSMTNAVIKEEKQLEIKKYTRINDWKASVLQSVLFLLSFLFITAGVYVEANTDYFDFINGFTAFNAVVPATGFLLSLTNWYFVKLYPSRKIFSWCSCTMTVIISFCAFIWCAFHYEMNIIELFSGVSFVEITEGVTFLFGFGIALTAFFTFLSKALSNLYAKMLGKE